MMTYPKRKNARRNAERKRLARIILMLALFVLLCTGIGLLVKAAAGRRKPEAPNGSSSAAMLPEIGVKIGIRPGETVTSLPFIGVPDVRDSVPPAETPSETKESRAPETTEGTMPPEEETTETEEETTIPEVITTAPDLTTEQETTETPRTTEAPKPPTTQPTTQKPTSPPTQPSTKPSTTATETTKPSTQPQTSGETVAPPVNVNGLRVWVGDSRTRGLKLYAGADSAKDRFICEDGTGVDWFEKTAVPQLEALIAEKTVSAVYINMGINDCASTYKTSEQNRSARYSRDINALVDRYPQIRFYFLSIGPGDGETYFSTNIPKMNAEADKFNAGMKEKCLAGYIPVAEYLKSKGFTTMDGLHYDAATCKKIYTYVLQMSEP